MGISQHNEFTFTVLLFNIFSTAIGTIGGWVVALWKLLRNRGKSALAIVAASKINQDDKDIALNEIRRMWWAIGILSGTLVGSCVGAVYLYFSMKPPNRVSLPLDTSSLKVNFLDISKDKWAESTPAFRPIIEKYVQESEKQEKNGDIKDWRLFKTDTACFGDLTKGQPTTITKLRVTYSARLLPILRTIRQG